PLDATDKRGHTVSVRLNEAELARLDSQRDAVQMQRGDGERIGKALGLQLSAELANCLRLLVLVRGDLIGV
ncbi:hypothetical protein, partial [Aeromonas caviae]|uniref:hypothetical protein n=1 Tax=Aeromonas caviae TaxID=648 RepID=UPI001CC6A2E8